MGHRARGGGRRPLAQLRRPLAGRRRRGVRRAAARGLRGELDGGYGAGQESLECGLYAEDEIPWDELAFRSIRRTIEHYYADRKTGHFGLHVETLHRKFEG